MSGPMLALRRKGIAGALLLCAAAAATLHAQRQLSWDALDVTAHLAADGVLDVVETQTMVFSGDWNGGERTFNLRPRQKLTFVGLERVDPATGRRVALTADASLDDVDDYAFTDSRTLRWRSRRSTDPPFSGARLTYAIHYQLSGILLKNDDRYTLDHDFAFPDRAGEIRRFALHLTLADVWKPLSEARQSYAAGPLAPGRSFVLTIPLRYSGAGSPLANDTRRPPEVIAAVSAILGFLLLSIAWLLLREQRLGRFAAVQVDVDADWIRQHIVARKAEVVGAAWDQDVDKDDVFALIARLVAEGKLASDVTSGSSRRGSLRLSLRVDRSQFDGYERALVDGLFFGERTTTSTEDIKAHYQKTGFDPAKLIQPELMKAVAEAMPRGRDPKVRPWLSLVLFATAGGCLAAEYFASATDSPAPIIVGAIAVGAALIAYVPTTAFRQRIDWGGRALAAFLVAPVLAAGVAAWYLWYRVGTGAAEWSPMLIAGLTAAAMWVVNAAVNGLKSRNHRDGIVFRKTLAAGRMFFQRELDTERPALSDDWFPWVAAFGLTNEADRWSVRHASSAHDDSSRSSTTGSGSSWSSGSSSSTPVWTGAGGGASGGAGGGATWSAALAGMAAGVAAPSSSGSGGGGGSSGGGSSGGGGGGGW
jgi:Predicted membrane protein (DUF2207) N-terminal domain